MRIREAGNIELKDDLSRMTSSRVRFAIANRAEIETKINQVYRAEGELHDLTSDLTADEDEAETSPTSPRSPTRRRSSGS